MSLARDFGELFEGNHEAIGTEDGGCVRHTGVDPKLSWWFGVNAHLTGHNPPIGVYPMVQVAVPEHPGVPDAWMVKWGCIDFDEGEEASWGHATRTHSLLKAFGAQSWIERSRSKGYHLWVFSRSWVPARVMRRCLLVAAVGSKAPTKEVNPKQETLKTGQLGNYVRLPYPGWLSQDCATGQRRVVVHPRDGSIIGLQMFVSRALASRTAPDTLEHIADAYRAVQVPVKRRQWPKIVPGNKRFDNLVEWLRTRPEGERNNSLFWAANRAIHDGVEDLEPLVEAATWAGLTEVEARRTIESAVRSS